MDTTIDETLKKGVKAHEETTQAYQNSQISKVFESCKILG